MTFRFGSWNVNNRRLKDSHVALLRKTRCDLLALQEVSAAFHAELAATSLFEWSVSSLVLRPPASADGRARRLGCSVFGRSPFRSVASQLLTDLAFPERALVVRTEARRWAITCCSFHTPPGANFGEIKPRTLKAIAEWLAGQKASIVLGIDANTPKTDHPNPAENEWWWDQEPILLGPNPAHHLCDVFRVFLGRRPDMLAAICAERPNGPLAVSHLRGRGENRTACRYDFIYASPDLVVKDVAYLYEEALAAGSDHALVVATLSRGSARLPNRTLQRTGRSRRSRSGR